MRTNESFIRASRYGTLLEGRLSVGTLWNASAFEANKGIAGPIRLRAITAAFVKRPRILFAIGEPEKDSTGDRWDAWSRQEPRFKCDEDAGNPSLRLGRYHQGGGAEEEAEV